jgi:hypothetical protein
VKVIVHTSTGRNVIITNGKEITSQYTKAENIKISIWEVCSNETSSGIVLGEEVEVVKNSPHGVETGVPLTNQPMDPLCKKTPWTAAGTITSQRL